MPELPEPAPLDARVLAAAARWITVTGRRFPAARPALARVLGAAARLVPRQLPLALSVLACLALSVLLLGYLAAGDRPPGWLTGPVTWAVIGWAARGAWPVLTAVFAYRGSHRAQRRAPR